MLVYSYILTSKYNTTCIPSKNAYALSKVLLMRKLR